MQRYPLALKKWNLGLPSLLHVGNLWFKKNRWCCKSCMELQKPTMLTEGPENLAVTHGANKPAPTDTIKNICLCHYSTLLVVVQTWGVLLQLFCDKQNLIAATWECFVRCFTQFFHFVC